MHARAHPSDDIFNQVRNEILSKPETGVQDVWIFCSNGDIVETNQRLLCIYSSLFRGVFGGNQTGDIQYVLLPDFTKNNVEDMLKILKLQWHEEFDSWEKGTFDLLELCAIDVGMLPKLVPKQEELSQKKQVRARNISESSSVSNKSTIDSTTISKSTELPPKELVRARNVSGSSTVSNMSNKSDASLKRVFEIKCPRPQCTKTFISPLTKMKDMMKCHIGHIHYHSELMIEIAVYFDDSNKCRECGKFVPIQNARKKHLIFNHSSLVQEIMKEVNGALESGTSMSKPDFKENGGEDEEVPKMQLRSLSTHEDNERKVSESSVVSQPPPCPFCSKNFSGNLMTIRQLMRSHIGHMHFGDKFSSEMKVFFTENNPDECKGCRKLYPRTKESVKKKHLMFNHSKYALEIRKIVDQTLREGGHELLEVVPDTLDSNILQCSLCNKRWDRTKDSFNKYYIKSHMFTHFEDQLASVESKYFDSNRCTKCSSTSTYAYSHVKISHLYEKHDILADEINNEVEKVLNNAKPKQLGEEKDAISCDTVSEEPEEKAEEQDPMDVANNEENGDEDKNDIDSLLGSDDEDVKTEEDIQKMLMDENSSDSEDDDDEDQDDKEKDNQNDDEQDKEDAPDETEIDLRNKILQAQDMSDDEDDEEEDDREDHNEGVSDQGRHSDNSEEYALLQQNLLDDQDISDEDSDDEDEDD